MQEEVTQKTIALYVKVGKGAARLTEQALQKAIQKFLEQKSKPAHGKQTMRQLMKQNAGVSNIEITDSNIKAFESTAKKYNLDFSLKKVKGEQTRYLVFFKGRDADVMTAAFQEFSAKKLNREKKPCSVRWKSSTRTESWNARRICSPNGPSSPIRRWLWWIRQVKHWRCLSRKKPAWI